MCTPGCRGNRRRPHKRVDEQKTQRPSSTEKKREKENQISFLGEGFGWCVCVCMCVWKMRRWMSGERRRGGGMDSVGEVSS